MQLILDAESTVDLKTKMSLSEENLEKCVSDILSDVKNGSMSNGDFTSGDKEAVKLKGNVVVDKIVQLKESVQINSATIDNVVNITAEIATNNVDTELSHDSQSTDIPNENKEIETNSEPIDQSQNLIESIDKENITVDKITTNSEPIEPHILPESIEKENTAVEKNITNSPPTGQLQNLIESIEDENTTVENNVANSEAIDQSHSLMESIEKENTTFEKNITNSEPIAQSHNLIENVDKENTTTEKNNTDNETGTTESVLKLDGLPENNLNKPLGESECAVTEPVTVCKDFVSDITTLQSNDNGSVNAEAVHDDAVSPCISNSNECVKIKEENDKTEVSDSKQINVSDNCVINEEEVEEKTEEIEKNKEETHTGSDSSLAIKVKQEKDIAQNTEISNDTDTKILETKIEEENLSVSEAKETMEIDSTGIDTSDDNIDLISLDAKSDWDVPEDSGIHKTRKEELSATENENIDNVTRMDVDESANNSNEQETEQLKVKPIKNTTELTEPKDCELIETDKTDAVRTLDLNSCDDGIVNLDDDKEKPTINMEKSESTQIITDDDKSIINCDDDIDAVENVEKSVSKGPNSFNEIIDLDENVPNEARDSKSSSENNKKQQDNNKKQQDNNKGSENSKPMEPVLKLSNTLDILSDDEEEQEKTPTNDSKCINIEDDDVVMLIDDADDTTPNENKSEPVKGNTVENESKPASPIESLKITEDSHTTEIDTIPEEDMAAPEKEVRETSPNISEKVEENKLQIETQKPLLPENFLKTCKKNLVDMTREELEEFCILKIVESILDRSNLSEIKNKLKVLTQNIEDYKKKASTLSKQNRDLHVVLKSIQDDIKKNNDAPIVPLKITRSVGMQVLMADKPEKRRRTGIGMPNTNKQLRTPAMQSPRPQKPPTQQIPVPRLVPANNTAIKSPNAQQANTGKVTSPLPNGVKIVSPAQKGEKRVHNRIQSVTVDLTDDEPPTKVVNRTQNPVPPVRLVPSQNLLAAPRTPGVNSPRKVYIPISGPQAQSVRPGQTIMLKTVPSASPRQRVPPPHMVRMPQSIRMSRPQGLRHPAPLPECMKQYQPPNWKALPPAPDLKLAKVENGIVISWKIEGYQEDSYEEIASYQLYAYQETTSPPNTALWKKIGDVKALPLPMACTLTQFMAGYKYYFAVRAVDIRSRLGPFSLPGSILLLNKM